MFNTRTPLYAELLEGDQMDYFGHWHPRWRSHGSDFGYTTFVERFGYLGRDWEPDLRRSYSEPDLNTGHQGVDFVRIRASENLQGLRTRGQQWTYVDLRKTTMYYRLASLVQPGALRDLRRYGIRGNTNIKRLRFE